jgi:hypothetical protein
VWFLSPPLLILTLLHVDLSPYPFHPLHLLHPFSDQLYLNFWVRTNSKHRQVLTPAVSSLRDAEPETCSKFFVRSAWTLADALYKSNEGIAAINLKMEALERIENEGIKEEGLEVMESKNKTGLEYWDEVYRCKGMDEWVVFSHR